MRRQVCVYESHPLLLTSISVKTETSSDVSGVAEVAKGDLGEYTSLWVNPENHTNNNMFEPLCQCIF